MGLEVTRTDFDESDRVAFASKLRDGLAAMREVLRRPGFGVGATTIGAEVEFSLVDEKGCPLFVNRRVLRDALDPNLSLELDRFNLEYNSTPVPIAGRPFQRMRAEIADGLRRVGDAASGYGGRIALIGILPTLRESDLQPASLTDMMRYRALSAALRRLRKTEFRVAISGEEELDVACDDVTMEGANTSLQIHLRVAPGDFARFYNAAQLSAALALAAGANSPTFLGKRLWRETRVALFDKAIDYRIEGPGWRPARVSFGHGWVRDGVLELFAESVALYEPLLPEVCDEDPLALARSGQVPRLAELCLHHGTVWNWNRAVYDAADGGHLRIELRCLPCGPTVADMMANCAFLVGLTIGLANDVDAMIPAVPFRFVRDNFYRAAQYGADATLVWPTPTPPSPESHRAGDLVLRLLPVARRGLESVGVDPAETGEVLGLIEERLGRNRTAATWQLETLEQIERKKPRRQALAEMFSRYLEYAATEQPLHTWPRRG
jgi:gamma-glutamyl:cysteine ligase YbdK (ATP-grasp superfamily)